MTPGVVIAGKYQLTSMVAHGGMGAVWRARHLLLDVDVAVKLMAPALAVSPDQRVRFLREAKAAAQIKSPHIVQIHDVGLDGDTPYIVMELLEGEDLGARLRRLKRFTLNSSATIATQVGRGLRKAHDMKIVHRDLKPANIFIAQVDGEEVVKILDFGIARAGEHANTGEITNTGDIIGSPPYMSPEQLRGLKTVDHRADQWSLAVVLFRLITGRLPFQSENVTDLVIRICTERAPAPSSFAPDLPPAIDAFFSRAFERDPACRFGAVSEMVGAFIQAARPPPVPADAGAAPAFPSPLRSTLRMAAPPPPQKVAPALVLTVGPPEARPSVPSVPTFAPEPPTAPLTAGAASPASRESAAVARGVPTPLSASRVTTASSAVGSIDVPSWSGGATTTLPLGTRRRAKTRLLAVGIVVVVLAGALSVMLLLGKSPEGEAALPESSAPAGTIVGAAPAAEPQPTVASPADVLLAAPPAATMEEPSLATATSAVPSAPLNAATAVAQRPARVPQATAAAGTPSSTTAPVMKAPYQDDPFAESGPGAAASTSGSTKSHASEKGTTSPVSPPGDQPPATPPATVDPLKQGRIF